MIDVDVVDAVVVVIVVVVVRQLYHAFRVRRLLCGSRPGTWPPASAPLLQPATVIGGVVVVVVVVVVRRVVARKSVELALPLAANAAGVRQPRMWLAAAPTTAAAAVARGAVRRATRRATLIPKSCKPRTSHVLIQHRLLVRFSFSAVPATALRTACPA